jgi:hypothetical protein
VRGPAGLPWWVGAAALLVGAGAGAVLHAALAPPRVVYVDRPVTIFAPAPPMALPPPSAVAVPSASIAPPSPDRAAPSATVARLAQPPVAASAGDATLDAGSPPKRDDDGLRRERAILDVARTALGRGDAASALDALARHAAEHPAGKLTEEREAMTIQSLVAAGRTSEARERADAFRQRYPRSFFLPSIDASLGTSR